MHNFILFLTGNLILCLITGAFFGIRRLFQRSLSAGSRYRFWYIYMGFLLLPFLPIPASLLPLNLMGSFFHRPSSKIAAEASSRAAASLAENLTDRAWMQDFYVSSDSQVIRNLPTLLFILWILGMCGFTAAALAVLLRTQLQLQSAVSVTMETFPEIASVFSDCQKEKNITSRVRLYVTRPLDPKERLDYGCTLLSCAGGSRPHPPGFSCLYPRCRTISVKAEDPSDRSLPGNCKTAAEKIRNRHRSHASVPFAPCIQSLSLRTGPRHCQRWFHLPGSDAKNHCPGSVRLFYRI